MSIPTPFGINSDIAFGDTTISVPDNRSYWQTTIELDSLGLIVEFEAGINAYTGVVHWSFNTIDPLTGQPPIDPNLGFLPPNDTTGRGEGHVSYTIRASEDSPDGTEIKNKATIIFDINEPIVTNEVVNVILTGKPDLMVSAVGDNSGGGLLLVGDTAVLITTIENNGQGLSDSCLVGVYLGHPDSGGVLVAQNNLGRINPGQSRSLNIFWIPTSAVGNSVLYFVADYTNAIDEMDELNNLRTLNVSLIQIYFPGDVDGDGFGPDISDLIYLVEWMFIIGDPPPLMVAADVNCSGGIPDIADLVYLIDYMFNGGPAPCDPGKAGSASQKFVSDYNGSVELVGMPLVGNQYCVVVWGEFDTEVAGFQQEYSYDGSSVVIDSIVAGPGNPLTLYSSHSDGRIKLGMVDLEGKATIGSGRSNVANIFFHSKTKSEPMSSAFSHGFTTAVDRNARKLPLDISTTKLWLTLPHEYALHQNYPNPFNPSTVISYALPKASNVSLTIFNILGQKVVSLVNKRQPAGYHEVIWSGVISRGKPVASGVYFYRLEAGDFTQSKKMLLLK